MFRYEKKKFKTHVHSVNAHHGNSYWRDRANRNRPKVQERTLRHRSNELCRVVWRPHWPFMQKHLVRPQFATGFQKAPFGRRTISAAVSANQRRRGPLGAVNFRLRFSTFVLPDLSFSKVQLVFSRCVGLPFTGSPWTSGSASRLQPSGQRSPARVVSHVLGVVPSARGSSMCENCKIKINRPRRKKSSPLLALLSLHCSEAKETLKLLTRCI